MIKDCKNYVRWVYVFKWKMKFCIILKYFFLNNLIKIEYDFRRINWCFYVLISFKENNFVIRLVDVDYKDLDDG